MTWCRDYYAFGLPIRKESRKKELILFILCITVILAVSLYIIHDLQVKLNKCQIARRVSDNDFFLDKNICYCPSCENIETFKKLAKSECEIYCVGYTPECSR